MDDTDGINEALQYLGSVVADLNGNWSFMLTNELTRTQGLRTSSTTNAPNVIPGFSANTTVGLSEFYYSGKQFLPFIKR
jgi:VCBS repeat-containing protein